MFLLVISIVIGAEAQSQQVLQVWSGSVPGFPEDFEHKAPVRVDSERITEVSQATISVFRASEPNENHASVVIFPGGGYRILADLKEGDRVASFLAEQGFTSFVVRYRVSKSDDKAFQFPGPLYDARQAIRYLKTNAEEFDIDPDKLGVMGFSAGGHLASMAATRDQDEIEGELIPDEMTDVDLRPAFAALIYPVATMAGPSAHGGSKRALFGDSPSEEELIAASADRRMSETSPPLFLIHTEFDPVDSAATLRLALAAKEAKVKCELHLYPTGGHGYGMKRPEDTELTNPVIAWPELMVKFLKRQ
jgi:acetyl esterase/lipase